MQSFLRDGRINSSRAYNGMSFYEQRLMKNKIMSITIFVINNQSLMFNSKLVKSPLKLGYNVEKRYVLLSMYVDAIITTIGDRFISIWPWVQTILDFDTAWAVT